MTLTQGCEVRACSAADIFDDPMCGTLLAEYERESANPLIGACSPQRKMYETLEGMGSAQCFGASVDGVMCGFAFVLISMVPHYDRKLATVESLFVAHAARGTGLGRYLMEAVESHCREAACKAIFYSAPVNSRLARLLFLSSDRYANTNHVFCRSLA